MDKRTISTEGLLTWAYQRELVGASGSGDGLWGPERRVEGKAQQSGASGAPGFLQLGERGSSGYYSGETSNGDGYGTARCLQALQLGAIIPSTGGGYASLRFAPPDADAVHRLVHDLLPKAHRLAVVHFASRGARPAVGDLPRLAPREVRGDGRPAYRYDRANYGHMPWLCDLCFDPDPKVCLAERALYRTWREGLRQLMVQLRLRPHLLARWQVTEETPPDEPPLPGWVGALLERPEVERPPMTAPEGARGWGQTEILRRLAEAS
jgi:hypothetical protein